MPECQKNQPTFVHCFYSVLGGQHDPVYPKTSKDLILEVIDYIIDNDFCPVLNPTNSNEVSISDDIDKTKPIEKFNKYKDKLSKNE